MEIHNAGVDYHCDDSFRIDRPYGSGDYLFVLFKTQAYVTLTGEEVLTEPGRFILYEKGKPQDYRTFGSLFSHDFVQFDFEDQPESLLLENVPMNTLIESPNPQLLSNAMQQISLEFFSNFKYKSASLSHLGQFFLLKVKEQTDGFLQKEKPNAYLEVLLSIRSEIYRYPQRKWTVPALAQSIPLSTSYFQGLYTRTFGIACLRDVIEARIALAKQYLQYSGSKVTDIAHLCGYANEVHFMRQFKEAVGLSPREFRNSRQ